eukprot:gene39318-53152_t
MTNRNVETIGYYAFGGCTSLTAIAFVGAVYAIGDYAFFGAYSLTTLNFDWYECNEGVE